MLVAFKAAAPTPIDAPPVAGAAKADPAIMAKSAGSKKISPAKPNTSSNPNVFSSPIPASFNTCANLVYSFPESPFLKPSQNV